MITTHVRFTVTQLIQEIRRLAAEQPERVGDRGILVEVRHIPEDRVWLPVRGTGDLTGQAIQRLRGRADEVASMASAIAYMGQYQSESGTWPGTTEEREWVKTIMAANDARRSFSECVRAADARFGQVHPLTQDSKGREDG